MKGTECEKTDRIDILLATCNGTCFLPVLLDSVLHQTYTDWHLIISDDHSTDGTADLIENYRKLHPDQISIIKSNVRLGSGKANFFFLLEHTDAKYVAFCDQDDYWKPNKLQKSFEEMKRLEKTYGQITPLLTYTDLEVVDKDLHVMNHSFYSYANLSPDRRELRNLLIQNVFTGCTMLINRTLADLAKQKQLDSIIMHDWWIALIAAAFGKIGYVSESTIQYRQHEHNTLGAKNGHSLRYLMKKMQNFVEIRNSMQDTTEQAAFFYEKFHGKMIDEQKSLTCAYAALFSINRLARYRFYVRSRVFKHGAARIIGQIIWG